MKILKKYKYQNFLFNGRNKKITKITWTKCEKPLQSKGKKVLIQKNQMLFIEENE